ncbi:(Fe-S)-binding protein [Priestia flexa]|jgi:glycolate oxidase iron-sulfur subunit|uniref:Glycolate oxidase iron-sulfur subunit n=1 Tax=Priestia flexa TaxID=86664 RepID=A0A8I1SN19_9BACI|nr:(Fe-S)-binding protein [Priestia flexa]MBN8251463.1 (Fe-S)-binding protein [Priestia flexa]MBN8434273.1 (Fe-S)-binding protein [Priestia flexa]MCA0966943.1 (Fe-S)-binding protein [Priestia flexa]RIV13658.1 (Fe-S)-binding protein [Priestia flexa]UIR31642.1 (Fe-S)-binding protein [Priestia flexa]
MTTVKEREKIQKQFKEQMNEDELLNCMRCGFCLPTCPTYIESGFQESHSPRGRIALMKAVVDGVIEPDEDVEKSLNMCLGCRACEPVCPSGVNYGHLLEEARDIINQNKKHSIPVKTIRKVVFEGLFPHQNRMQNATGLLSFYQRSGLQRIVRSTGILKLLPDNLASMETVLPTVPPLKEMKNRPTHLLSKVETKKRVAFFSGCLMDTMFMKTNDATMKLLQLAGCEIVIPKNQACCGALHGHSGEKDGAKQLAKRNIQAFEDLKIDYIITNAGGCGAFLIDYDHLLKDDVNWAERAQAFSKKLKDISSILVDLEFFNMKLSLPQQVITYQDSCHLRNVMKTSSEPRKLLKAIANVEYREMKNADSCCGSAGIYNIVESEMSMQILDTKMKNAVATQATTIVTANPGCLLQMKLGIEREGLSSKVRAVHLVDLLLEAVQE